MPLDMYLFIAGTRNSCHIIFKHNIKNSYKKITLNGFVNCL